MPKQESTLYVQESTLYVQESTLYVQESTLYVQESALYVQESALYIKEDSEQALEEMAAPEPALYRKRCPQCGSVEFELLVRDGRRVEVCENCGQPFQAEDR